MKKYRLEITVHDGDSSCLVIKADQKVLLEIAQSCIAAAGWSESTEIYLDEDLRVEGFGKITNIMVDRLR